MTTATLTAWTATYKPTAKARKTKTIAAFFAASTEAAHDYAARVVDRETFGEGVLVLVEATADPRMQQAADMVGRYHGLSAEIVRLGRDRDTGMVDYDRPGVADLDRQRDELRKAIRAAGVMS